MSFFFSVQVKRSRGEDAAFTEGFSAKWSHNLEVDPSTTVVAGRLWQGHGR